MFCLMKRFFDSRLPDRWCGVILVCWLVGLVLPARAVSGGPDFSKFALPVFHPALQAAALTNHIPLTGIDAPIDDSRLLPGDSLTAVLTLHEKNSPSSQWLLFVKSVVPGPRDKPSKPDAPNVLYASTGDKLEFTNVPAWVELRTMGPFADGAGWHRAPAVRDDRSRFTMEQGFLAMGMDRAAEAIIRMTRLREERGLTNWLFTVGEKPPPAEKARENARIADGLGLTKAEKRAMAGAAPAMLSYFALVGETPRLESLMYKIIDLPSVWSVVGNLGVKVDLKIDTKNFARAPAEGWGVPGTPAVYYLPTEFSLNRHPALRISLAVTTPHPPLLACGGIVGILAEKPSDPATYLTVRVVSARFAGGPR